MRHLTACLLLGLAALGASKPISSLTFDRRAAAPNVSDPVEMCDDHRDLSTYENAKNAWDQTGAGVSFDILLSGNWGTDKGWLEKMVTDTFPEKGASDLDGCMIVGGTCAPESNCTDYVVNRHRFQAYWVLTAVKGLHDKMSYAREKMQDAGIISGINVDVINSDFTVELTGQQNTLKYIAAAFSMVSGLATGTNAGNAQVRGGLTLASGAFTEAANTQSTSVAPDKEKMEDWLVAAFKGSTQFIDSTLKTALGDGDTSTLPYQSNFYQSHVSNYFADGVWLVDDDNKAFLDSIDHGKDNFNKKLVDLAIDEIAGRLIADVDMKQSDCTGTGKVWLPAKGSNYCFYFTTLNGGRGAIGGGCTKDPMECADTTWKSDVGDDFYKKMTKQGIDLKDYYTSIIDCTINGGKKEVDTTKLPLDGSTPQCFYQVPAYKIKWHQDYSGAPKYELGIEDF